MNERTSNSTGPRATRLALKLLLLAAAACPEHTVRYTQAQDDAAIALVASTWTEDPAGGIVLSLCEDLARSDAWPGPDCSVEHVVRGGARALEHVERRPMVGCGGCPFMVQAYVVGTISGGPFPAPVVVRGEVNLGSGNDDDPYALPWGLVLRCEGGDACELMGNLQPDGSLTGTLTGPGGALASQRAFTRTADAVCP